MSEGNLGIRKSLFIVVVVVGCFAVLWPKVLQPMLVGPSTNHQRLKPNNLDKGCCDVISDIDINTIKIMNELCNSIIQHSDTKPSRGQDISKYCRTEILNNCGIDISAVLQAQVRLGRPFKQIVDELRSFNGSICLKNKFGISPWSLGVPHKVTINLTPIIIKQERPTHLRPEMLHPALKEKGSAISQPFHSPAKGPNVKYVEGRPGPIPGMRPPMGGGQIAQPQKGLNSMGLIMPLYTIAIVIFFSYTLMKVVFRKKPEGPGGPLYPPVEPSPIFRREVFESIRSKSCRDPASSKLGDEELDHLRQRLRETELIMERIVNQMAQVPLRSQKDQHAQFANGTAKQPVEQPSVKILGMETTASCEGGQKWSRPESPVIPSSPAPPPEPVEPPQEIYLEGALPAQSRLLVSDAITEPERITTEDPAVVLASKMTLSVISSDMLEENGKYQHQNGDLDTTENEDGAEESKYTTASCATAAESDLSEDEHTDDEVVDEIAEFPDCVVDNGIQEIDKDFNTDEEDEIDVDIEEEEIIEEWIDEPKLDSSDEFEGQAHDILNYETILQSGNKLGPIEQNDSNGNNQNHVTLLSNTGANDSAKENDLNENIETIFELQNNNSNGNLVTEDLQILSNIMDDVINMLPEQGTPNLYDINKSDYNKPN